MSRSTWACELKSACAQRLCRSGRGHAPRERVSWNVFDYKYLVRGTTSRSTWACELKYVRLGNSHRSQSSRSTWACELKCKFMYSFFISCRHAPRERVSWNLRLPRCNRWRTRSRSTWACELKWKVSHYKYYLWQGHAPRERVSWNNWFRWMYIFY